MFHGFLLEIISASVLTAETCATEEKEALLAQQVELHDQNEENIQQESVYEIPLIEQNSITEQDSNLIESVVNNQSEIIAVPKRQVIKRTTGMQTCQLILFFVIFERQIRLTLYIY